MKTIQKADGVADGIMALGAINSGLIGLARLNMMSKIFGRRSIFMRTAYALVGLAAIYRLARILIPKSRHQQRLEKIDKTLHQFEQLEHQLKTYASKGNELGARLKSIKAKAMT
jgi:uncharacterized membrane protein YuzA (DUF378 family)